MASTPPDERLRKALAKAEQLWAAESFNDLIAWCRKILSVYPGQPEAQAYMDKAQGKLNERLMEDIFALVQREEEQGDYQMALNHLERIFQIDPSHEGGLAKKAELEALLRGEPATESEKDFLPDPSDLLQGLEDAPAAEVPTSQEAFGIDEDDPFALGAEASAAPAPPAAPKRPSFAPQTSAPAPESGGEFDLDGGLPSEMEDSAEDVSSDNSGFELHGQSSAEDIADAGESEPADMSAFEIAGQETAEPPMPTPPAPEPENFDLAEAAAEPVPNGTPPKALAPAEQAQIKDLLKKGTAYFERGQCQLAIDAWYQILLVDEGHQEAHQLIAKAQKELEMQGKQVKLDLPQQPAAAAPPMGESEAKERVRTLIVEARKIFDEGDFEGTLARCEQVLQIEPAHQEANRLTHEANLKLQIIKKREELKTAKAAAPTSAAAAGPYVANTKPLEIKIAKPPANRLPLLLLGVMVLLLLIGAGAAWFVISRGKPEPVQTPPPSAPKAAPQTAQPKAVEAPPTQTVPAPTAEELAAKARAEADSLLALSKKFLQDGLYLEAQGAFNECMALVPTHPEALAFKEQVESAAAAFREETQKREAAIAAFRQNNYEQALRLLYRLKEPKHFSQEFQRAVAQKWYAMQTDQKQVQKLIQSAWFNSTVLALQGGNLNQAKLAVEDCLRENPGDAQAKEMQVFINRYANVPKDAAYQAYVDSLTLRGE